VKIMIIPVIRVLCAAKIFISVVHTPVAESTIDAAGQSAVAHRAYQLERQPIPYSTGAPIINERGILEHQRYAITELTPLERLFVTTA
jgi:hypothetical protein